MVNNPPANAGDEDLVPGSGWSNARFKAGGNWMLVETGGRGGVRGAWLRSQGSNVPYPWTTVCNRAQALIKETILWRA